MSYLYYQVNGGEEEWLLTQEVGGVNFEDVKPTFITVLSLDKIVPDKPDREFLESIKYAGPMYFDLDDAQEIANSIADAKELVNELINEYNVKPDSIDVYLTGKKGLHIVIPSTVFMLKPAPMRHLPHIYKEMAFTLSKPTVDFRVYTARKGRMLRTCYRQRPNGNWRVPISVAELRELTPAKYAEWCAVPPRPFAPAVGEYSAKFNLHFAEAAQKFASKPKKATKSVTPQQVKAQEPTAQAIMAGATNGAGFNVIAMQIALYAREAGWKEDFFIEQCDGLINNHQSDGDRYNSPAKRERSLREMFYYVEDNPGYAYSLGGLKSVAVNAPEVDAEGNEVESTFSMGVQRSGDRYIGMREGEETPITNFFFSRVVKLVNKDDESILSIKATLAGDSNVHEAEVILLPNQFTGSGSLSSVLAPYGASFQGNDAQARGLLQVMLRAVDETNYVIDCEGLSMVSLPRSQHECLRAPFPVWADSAGVAAPDFVKSTGITFTFQGWPDPTGVIKTDLAMSPKLKVFLAEEGNKQRMKETLLAMLGSNEPAVIGRMLGWCVACFYRPMLHALYNQFPVMHVYGPSGAGKTATVTAFMSMFYYHAAPIMVTPSSTPFALITLLSGSGSIPVVLDEYKPGTMEKGALEKYRAILRDMYNMKGAQRGGGNAKKDNYNALTTAVLSGPLVFMAETMEGETAINQRIVAVRARPFTESVSAIRRANFAKFSSNGDVMTALGLAIATQVQRRTTLQELRDQFDPLWKTAQDNHMSRPQDLDLVAEGKMSKEEHNRREANLPRPIYNSVVVQFGLKRLSDLLKGIFGEEEFAETFQEHFDDMDKELFVANESLKDNLVPEYVKALNFLSSMTRIDGYSRLIEGTDYNLYDFGGQERLVMDPVAVYNKYGSASRMTGSTVLYPTVNTFVQAMVDCPQFLGKAERLKDVRVPCVMLDYGALQRSGVIPFSGKTLQAKM